MKRITYILLSVLLTLSTVSFPAIGSGDYSGHWAENEIKHLVAEGIISGYGDGTIRPDGSITRAEVAVIINKTFGFYEISDEGFKDIKPDDWYCEDLLIAKRAGYMIGDEDGNANPEANISRAEYSAMVARVLKLETTETTTGFSDDAVIPLWAKGYISALVKRELLSGYSDGSFRAEKSVLRGEAFYVLSKTLKKNETEKPTEKTESPIVIPSNSSSSSSGGGGGGGGGGAISGTPSNVLSKPVIRRYDIAEEIIYFDNVKNADTYILYIKTDEFEKNYTLITQQSGSQLMADISSFIDSAKADYSSESFSAELKIKATGAGYVDSSYVSIDETIIEKLPAVDKPVIDYVISGSGAEEIFSVSWSEVTNAGGYDVKLFVNEVQQNSLAEIDLSARTLKLKTSYSIDSNVVLKISAISGNENLKNSDATECLLSLSAFSGSGTDEDPYMIRTAAQLLNITDKKAVYIIADNIVVDNWTPFGSVTEPFTGKIIGKLNNVEGAKPTITLNINSVDGNQGFIGVMESGSVSDLIIAGKISGSSAVGGICGNMKGGEISDCIVMADITAGDDAGGIAGICQGKISKCANAGNITATTSRAGGIAGFLHSIIEQSYNSGNISAPREAGGIAGSAATGKAVVSITDCYSSGTIDCENRVAGIVYAIGSNGATELLTIKNTYVSGGIISSLNQKWKYSIYGEAFANEKIISNNYYLNALSLGNGNMATDDPMTPVADSLTALPSGFSSEIWEIKDNIYGYNKPQLKAVPHIEKIKTLSTLASISVVRSSGIHTLSYGEVANASGYYIEVWSGDERKGEFNIDSSSTLSVDITSAIGDVGIYIVKLTALGDNILFADSETAEYEYDYNILPGSQENPFIIASTEDFANITDLTAYYKITADITVNTPLGDASENVFSGGIIGDKGNGEAPVVTLAISGTEQYTGFVSCLSGGIIDNIIFEGTVSSTAEYTAAVAGYVNKGAKIRNCINNATVSSSNAQNIAGIAGRMGDGATEIINCINNAAISSFGRAAGIVSRMDQGSVSYCENNGNITGGDTLGGICSRIENNNTSSITKCSNSGRIGTANTSAGIVGFINSSNIVSDCYNKGVIVSSKNTAGICATTNGAVLTNCYNAGSFEGITGKWAYFVAPMDALMSNCYYLNTINGGNGNGGVNAPAALTDTQMQSLSSFGFSESIWNVNTEAEYKYPILKPYSN